MDKEDFKRKALEEQIYQELKNDIRINTMNQLRFYLREKGIENKIDSRELYVRITNHRIKVFGSSSFDIAINREDRHKYILNKYQ